MAERSGQSGTLSHNRRATHDYEILERIEAGIVLSGTEIKSARQGRVNIRDAYAREENGELWLLNAHISTYDKAHDRNHDPDRPRKLLLHKDQLARLAEATNQRGQTVVPLAMYLKRGRAKVELGIGRGKKAYDKRDAVAKRDAEREIARALRHNERR